MCRIWGAASIKEDGGKSWMNAEKRAIEEWGLLGFGAQCRSSRWCWGPVGTYVCESAFLLVAQLETLRCVFVLHWFIGGVTRLESKDSTFFLEISRRSAASEAISTRWCREMKAIGEALLWSSRRWSESGLTGPCVWLLLHQMCVSVKANSVQLNKQLLIVDVYASLPWLDLKRSIATLTPNAEWSLYILKC